MPNRQGVIELVLIRAPRPPGRRLVLVGQLAAVLKTAEDADRAWADPGLLL